MWDPAVWDSHPVGSGSGRGVVLCCVVLWTNLDDDKVQDEVEENGGNVRMASEEEE